MKKISLSLFTLFVSFYLSGCAISAGIPAMRMDSPEAVGRGKIIPKSEKKEDPKEFVKDYRDDDLGIRLAIGLQGSTDLTIVKDYTDIPPDISNPSIEKDAIIKRGANGKISLFSMDNIKPAADFSLIEKLDVIARFHWDHPWMFGLKYQFLGDSEKSAKKGNFSLSASSTIGYANDSAEVKAIDGLSSLANKSTANVNVNYFAYDLALIAGFRTSDNFLIYGGPFIQRLKINGKITQPYEGSTHYTIADTARTKGINLGAQLSFPRETSKLFVKAEISVTRFEYKTISSTLGYWGAQIGTTY